VPAKRVFVKTFGCQMNVYDSERMIEALAPAGFEETPDMSDADLVILNTCHIREKAAEKIYSELGRVRQVRDSRRLQGKKTTIAVAGCVAQAEGQEIIERAPVVDIVVGPQSYHTLDAMVSDVESKGKKIVKVDLSDQDKFEQLPRRSGPRVTTAFLTVQEGCDKFCTFCVVPYTRGMEYSRPVGQLLDEAKALAERGVCEITLLGQNVNAYRGEGPGGQSCSLAQLIEKMSEIEGIKRLRYTTSHPRDMSDDLLNAHRDNQALMPYLHLPFQAGSDRILAAMNRKHTAKEYLSLIDRIRSAKPDIAISTDIIVGFPGETTSEFEETLRIVETVGFAQAFSFKYSARPGTPAATMQDPIDDAEKTARLHALQALLQQQQRYFNEGCVGKTLPVLFERQGRSHGQLIGRSPYLQPVHADAEHSMLGQILSVEIKSASKNSLAGVVFSD